MEGRGLVLLEGINHDKENSANAVGKTYLFNTICLVLFGKIITVIGGEVGNANDDVVTWGSTNGCRPRVVFEDDVQRLWRATLARKAKGSCPYINDHPDLYPYAGTDLYLERYDAIDDRWIDERCAEMINTRKKLIDVLGMSFERYTAVTYLAQGQGFDFIKGGHSKRMAVLSDMLGFTSWDVAAEKAKVERDTARGRVQTLTAKRSAYVTMLGQLVVPTDADLAMAETRVKEAGESKATHATLITAQRSIVESMAEQRAQLQAGGAPRLARETEIRNTLGRALQEAQGRFQEAKAARQQAEAQLCACCLQVPGDGPVCAAREALVLQEATTGCPLCGQSLPREQREAKIAELVSRLHALESDLDIKVREAAASYLDQLRSLSHTLDVLEAKEDEERDAVKVAADAEHEAQAALPPYVQLNDIDNHLAGARTRLQQLEAQHAHAGNIELQQLTILAQTRERHQQAATLRGYLTDIDSVLPEWVLAEAEYQYLMQHFGDKGLKTWLLSQEVDRINANLDKLLSMFDPSLRVSMTLMKTTKKGEAVPEIELVVDDSDRGKIPLYLHSGGESTIIAFCLLLALWQLAIDNGKGSGLLILDEMLGYADSRTTMLAAQVIESLRAPGRTIIVVSHAQGVSEIAFDARWIIEKTKGQSIIITDEHEKKT
jgi:DNA repair exonuclease SbcCD ATPase subunit